MFFLNRSCQLHVMDIFNMCIIKVNPNFAPFGSFVCICISFTDNLQYIPICVPKFTPYCLFSHKKWHLKGTNHPFNSHSATLDLHNLHPFLLQRVKSQKISDAMQNNAVDLTNA